MYFKRVLFLITISVVFFSNCIAQNKPVPIKPAEIPVITLIDVKHSKFDSFLKKLKENCDVKIVDEGDLDCNNSILVRDHGTHLKIDFKTKKDFKSHSFKLTNEAKQKLKCIAPLILNSENLLVQIIGHANDSISISHNQHLSNNRAIVAAELFYKEGIDDIYAKGCPEPKVIVDQIDADDSFVDRSINIYIYSNKSDMKNPCP